MGITFDTAYQVHVSWVEERCATCSRNLPRFDDDGCEERAWQDDELEAIFCNACYWRWLSEEYGDLEEAARDLPVGPLAIEVVRALIRREGVLTFTQAEHMAKVLGDLDASAYEATPIWKERRDRFITTRPHPLRCELCLRSIHHPQVHHRTYERKTCELDADLAVLCDDCHTMIHRPHLNQSKRQFLSLQRDFEARRLLDGICLLLPYQGWLDP